MRVLWGLILMAAAATAHAAGPAKFLTLEDAAVAQAKRWQQTGVAKPIMSDDGKVVFPFGQYMPTVTCAPLRACDIELEAGELVTGKPLAGDAVRWKVSKAESGAGDKRVTHVVVKPLDVNLDTNLIITTNKRTYHIRLYSSPNEADYVNRVGFYYPQDLAEEWDESERVAEHETKAKQKLVVAEMPGNVSVEQLDFGYRIEGDDVSFKPVRVFNEGTHVFIQMPASMRTDEAPVLLLLDKAGSPQLVNYRPKDDYYIVDKLFDKAILVIGTGKSQSKVTITWTKNEKKSWFR
jgi:P-type conjugative transfer protein TrbG